MHSIITIIHILAAATLVGLVLIQHGKGADAGAAFGSGSAGSVFGARGPATFLSRATAVLAVAFFATSLSLAYLSGKRVAPKSVVERVAPASVPGPQAPAPSDVPTDEGATGAPAPETTSGSGTHADVPTVPDGANQGK